MFYAYYNATFKKKRRKKYGYLRVLMPRLNFSKQMYSWMSLTPRRCMTTKCMQLFGNSLAQTKADVINSTSIIIVYRCRLCKFDLQSVAYQIWWVVSLGERDAALSSSSRAHTTPWNCKFWHKIIKLISKII